MNLEDSLGKECAEDVIKCLLKDKDCKIFVEDVVKLGTQSGDSKVVKMSLKGSFLSNEGAKNVKEIRMSTIPSLLEVAYGGRLGRVEFYQVPLAWEKKMNQPDLHLLPLGLENQRNCCFLNSIFQVLSLTPRTELFLTQSYSSISPTITAKCGFCPVSCPIRMWSSLKLLDLEEPESKTLSNADEGCLVSSELSMLSSIRAWSNLNWLDLEEPEFKALSSADEDCLVSFELSRFSPIRAWNSLDLLFWIESKFIKQ